MQQPAPATPKSLPVLVVDSPASARSPHRSPRTASLLLALRDVIGPDGAEEQSPPTDATTWNDAMPTLVNQQDFERYSQPQNPEHDELDEPDADHSWTAISDYGDDDDEEDTMRVVPTSTGPIEDDRVSEAESGLLSPIELSTLHLGPFRHDNPSLYASMDSQDMNNWQPPAPLLASPPRSPSTSSTLDILASPFRNYSTSIFSPRLSAFIAARSVAGTPTPGASPSSRPGAVHPDAEDSLDLGLDSPRDRPSFSPLATTTHDDPHPVIPDSTDVAAANDQPSSHDGTLSLDDIHVDRSYDTSEGDEEEFWGGPEACSILGDNDEEEEDGGTTAVYPSSLGLLAGKTDEEEQSPTVRVVPTLHDNDEGSRDMVRTHHDNPASASLPPSLASPTIRDEPSNTNEEEDTTNLAYLRSPSVTESLSPFPMPPSVLVPPTPTQNSSLSPLLNLFPIPGLNRPSLLVPIPSPTDGTPSPTTPSPGGSAQSGRPPFLENDTIGSLYDIYSGIAPLKDVIADSMRNAGLSPPAGGEELQDDEEEDEDEDEADSPPSPGPTSALQNPDNSLSSSSSSSLSFSNESTHTHTRTSTPASSVRERVFSPPPLATNAGSASASGSGSMTPGPAAELTGTLTRRGSLLNYSNTASVRSLKRLSISSSASNSRPNSPSLSARLQGGTKSGRMSPFSPLDGLLNKGKKSGPGSASGSAAGRQSPFSPLRLGSASGNGGGEEVPSRVVPFGFRSSLASQPPTIVPATSPLLSKRNSRVLQPILTNNLGLSLTNKLGISCEDETEDGIGPLSAPNLGGGVYPRSAGAVEDSNGVPSPASAPVSAGGRKGLRPLRLSAVLNSASPSSTTFSSSSYSHSASKSASSISHRLVQHQHHQHSHIPAGGSRSSSASVSSESLSSRYSHRSSSLSNNPLLSSTRSPLILPPHISPNPNPNALFSPSASSTPPRTSPHPTATATSELDTSTSSILGRRRSSRSSSGSGSSISGSVSLSRSGSISLYSTRRRMENLRKQEEEREKEMREGPRSAPVGVVGSAPWGRGRSVSGASSSLGRNAPVGVAYRRPSSRLSERSVPEEDEDEVRLQHEDDEDFTATSRLSALSARYRLASGGSGDGVYELNSDTGRFSLERHDLVDETIRQPLSVAASSLSASTSSSSSSSSSLAEPEPASAPAPLTVIVPTPSFPSSSSSSSVTSNSNNLHTPHPTTGSTTKPRTPLTSTFPTTPKPANLLFALASDDPSQVLRALTGTPTTLAADPNEMLQVGAGEGEGGRGEVHPLEFVLGNERLMNKLEIVKVLLAFGADVGVLRKASGKGRKAKVQGDDGDVLEEEEADLVGEGVKNLMDSVDPATRYFLSRAEGQPKGISPSSSAGAKTNPSGNTTTTTSAVATTAPTSALASSASAASALQQSSSFFGPLTRVRYEVVGQDRALEQMFRVLSMQSSKSSHSPIVMLLCGPSGHGKSLLARKFGSLLDVPTHTVNMTTLRSTHDLWQSYSINPYSENKSTSLSSSSPTPSPSSPHTLAEFLINNEGKRCVVVLDEIEKTENEKTLWSLLMPWELGRCTFEATSRHVDVRNVIWLGTSNVGCDLVLEFDRARVGPGGTTMTREEYVRLMKMLRPKVSEKLGPSVLSRVTTVLPFVPFTADEKRAICYEALHTLGGDSARNMTFEETEQLIDAAMGEYVEEEGARSLHRAVSSQLVDML